MGLDCALDRLGGTRSIRQSVWLLGVDRLDRLGRLRTGWFVGGAPRSSGAAEHAMRGHADRASGGVSQPDVGVS